MRVRVGWFLLRRRDGDTALTCSDYSISDPGEVLRVARQMARDEGVSVHIVELVATVRLGDAPTIVEVAEDSRYFDMKTNADVGSRDVFADYLDSEASR